MCVCVFVCVMHIYVHIGETFVSVCVCCKHVYFVCACVYYMYICVHVAETFAAAR